MGGSGGGRAIELDSDNAILFPPFVLDLRGGRLLRGGETIPLRPKTWAVLCYLAERPGVLVTKEELFARIWSDTAVGDDTLTKCISEIRSALGDDRRAPRFLATVHGRGFRWVAEASGQRPPVAAAEHDAPLPLPVDERAPAMHFVGRSKELGELSTAFRRASGGQRQIFFVTGEAGIGKTALVDTLLSDLAARQPRPLVGHGCSVEQTGAREAYLPFLAALEGLARDAEVEGLASLLQRYAPTWLAQVPWLIDAGDAKALSDSLVGTRPERMLREFCAFVEVLTERRALVLVLEDLHWSDPATVELLVLLAQRPQRARLLLIATCRSAEAVVAGHPLVAAKQTLLQRRRCTEIPLHYLDLSDVQAYLDERLPGLDRPEALARLIHEHTEGSPLFMTAVLDDLVSRGWLVETSPGWALAVPVARADLGVPDDLRQMITMQLQAMSSRDQALLEAACVAGTDFTAAVLAAALDLALDDVEDACDRLSRVQRFLRITGTAEWPPEGTVTRYGFVHALHRHVVYEAIPHGRRRRLHQRIGEAIESAHGEGATQLAAELAVHFERGRDHARTIKYLAATATRALQRFATPEAIVHLERALKTTERLSDERERLRRELDLRALLGSALGSRHGYASEAAHENYQRVRVLCEKVGSTEDLYRAEYALWHCQAARAEPAAVETAARMVALARTIGTPEVHAQAEVIRGRTLFWQGHFEEAQSALEGVLGFWNHRPGTMDGSAALEPPGIAVYAYDGVTLWLLGYPDRARSRIREAVAVGEQAADPFVLAGTFLHAAYITHLWRDDREVERLAQRALALSDEHDFPFWSSMALTLLGWASVQRGDAEHGVELIGEGLTRHRSSGARIIFAHMLGFLADAHLRLGNSTAGLEAVEEGLASCETTLDRVYEPELWRLKGELSADRPSEAGGCLRRALELACERGAKSLELRIATSLARLERGRSKRGEAGGKLATLYDWFDEGFDTRDLQDARALLEALGRMPAA